MHPLGYFGGGVTSPAELVGSAVIFFEIGVIACEVLGVGVLDEGSVEATGGDPRNVGAGTMVTLFLATTSRSPFTSMDIVSF